MSSSISSTKIAAAQAKQHVSSSSTNTPTSDDALSEQQVAAAHTQTAQQTAPVPATLSSSAFWSKQLAAIYSTKCCHDADEIPRNAFFKWGKGDDILEKFQIKCVSNSKIPRSLSQSCSLLLHHAADDSAAVSHGADTDADIVLIQNASSDDLPDARASTICSSATMILIVLVLLVLQILLQVIPLLIFLVLQLLILLFVILQML